MRSPLKNVRRSKAKQRKTTTSRIARLVVMDGCRARLLLVSYGTRVGASHKLHSWRLPRPPDCAESTGSVDDSCKILFLTRASKTFVRRSTLICSLSRKMTTTNQVLLVTLENNVVSRYLVGRRTNVRYQSNTRAPVQSLSRAT